jgi:hypothetical protein
MKRNFFKLLFLSIFVFSFVTILSNCGSGKEKTDNQDSTTVEANNKPLPGEIPFDFPISTTTSKTGEYVLCPSKAFLDEAWTEGGTNSTFIFYSRTMSKPGEAESEVTEISENVVIPNSLIIPIPANQEAKKGDILLTWWQSGSGMKRAIVMDDTNPKEPKVRYLDLEWEYYGETEDILKPNSFVKITEMWQPGTSVAYKDDYYMNHVQIIKVEGDKVLTLGWAGRIAVVKKSDCTPIPVTLELKTGDKVQVPHIGSYTNGTIKKFDAKVGRAWVEIEFGGQNQEIVVALGDIAKDLKLE